MRHEPDLHTEVVGNLAFVHMVHQLVGQQVVSQHGGIVLAAGLLSRTTVAGYSECVGRADQLVDKRRKPQLHAGGVASGVGNSRSAHDAVGEPLRLSVGPGCIKAVVCTQIYDNHFGAGAIDGIDI